MIGIGTELYVYEKPRYEPKTLDDYLRQWHKFKIVEETRVSWIVMRDNLFHTRFRIEKKTQSPRGDQEIVWSLDVIKKRWYNKQFINDHAYKIAERVRRCYDVESLTRIAQIVGYTEHLK